MKHCRFFTLLAALVVAGFAHAADHIVFIHGWQMFGGGSSTWDRMVQLMVTPETTGGAEFRRREQLHVAVHGDDSRGIETIAGEVYKQIENGFPDGTKVPAGAQMDFVVHSMGGLVLRSMVKQRLLEPSQIGRVVTLATPHYGQKFKLTQQQKDMSFGSEFIWDLANADRKIPAYRVLCLAGTSDDVVKEWSAALEDKDCTAVRYVDKIHSSLFGKRAICHCLDGHADPVYRLVTGFLGSGAVSGGGLSGVDSTGSVLFRVIDASGNPVPYSTWLPMVLSVQKSAGGNTFYGEYQFAFNDKGTGAIAGGLGNCIGVDPGRYHFTFANSSDDNIKSFKTKNPIEVVRGRTTVETIKAEINATDFVFLIDSTGSMGDDINKVKESALKLVGKLMGGGSEVRVAVADYRDHPQHTKYSSDYPFRLIQSFTSDSSAVISAINSITVDGGGDSDESLYTALFHCLSNNGKEIGQWRKEATKTIMWMTDAGAHDPDYEGHTRAEIARLANEVCAETKPGYKTLMAKTMLMAADGASGSSAGVALYPVLTSSSSSSVRGAYSELAEATGGKLNEVASFDSVVEAISDVVGDVERRNGIAASSVKSSESAKSVTLLVYGGNASAPSSVEYWVLPGTAKANKDYKALKKYPGKISWRPGEVGYKELTVSLKADKTLESDEFFTVVLANAKNMGLTGNTICRVTLRDSNVSGSLSSAVGNVAMTTKNTSGWSVARVSKDGSSVLAAKGKTSKYGKTIKMKTTFKAPDDGYFYFDVHFASGYSNSPLVIYDGKKAIGQISSTSETTSGWKRYYLPMLKKGKHTLTWSVTQQSYSYKTTVYLNGFFFYPEDRAVYSLTAKASNSRAGDVSGSGIYWKGSEVKVTAKARPGWKFVSWTATGVKLSKPKSASQKVKIKSSNIELVAKFSRDTYVSGISALPSGGTVSGSAYCKKGKSVKLKAVAKSGYAFLSWSDGSVSPTLTVKQSVADSLAEDGVATFVAYFKKQKSVKKPSFSLAASSVVNGTVGVRFELPLPCDSECKVTLSAKGLPKGLSVSGNVISGVPKKAGTSKVTISAKNAGGTSKLTVKIVVAAFPKQLVGSYSGYLTDAAGEIAGSYTATVSSAGKVSAKVITGKTVSFESSSWATLEDDTVSVDLTAKGGHSLSLSALATKDWQMYQMLGAYDGKYRVFAQANRWQETAGAEPPSKDLAKWRGSYKYITASGESVKLTVGKKGIVTGTVGKRTVSTVLLADSDSRLIVVWLPADKSKKLPKIAESFELTDTDR